MKLNQFNGGLNVRVAPELINPSQSIRNLNVDMESGNIASQKGLGDTIVNEQPYPYFWQIDQSIWPDGHIRDYLSYQNNLYWTIDCGPAQKWDGERQADLGLPGPGVEVIDIVWGVLSYIDNEDGTVALFNTLWGVTIEFTDELDAVIYTDPPYGVVTDLRPFVETGISLPAPELQVTEMTFDNPPILLQITGDFPNTNEVAWYTLLSDSNGLVYVGITTADVQQNSGAELSIDTSYPPHMTLKYGRYYNGNVHEVPTTDDVWDISGNALLDLTYTDKLYREGDRLSLQAALTETVDGTTYIGALSDIVDHTIGAGEVWLDLVIIPEPETVGEDLGTAAYINRRQQPYEDVTSLYDSGVYWEDTGITGTFQYVFTYYDVIDGTESAPSGVTTELDVVNGYVKYTVYASDNPNVSHIFVYRVGGGLLQFTRIAEHPNVTATYKDATKSIDVTGPVLDSELNLPPPDCLRFLVESHGIFFGALGPKLYFTKDGGNPNYWPATYYIDMHDNITGIAVIASGVAVFTKYSTHLISGTGATTFVKYLISGDQGCVNHKTIANKAGNALFISTDGVCTITANDVQVVGKPLLGKQVLDTVNAVLFDEMYFIQQADGLIAVYDLRYEPRNFSLLWFDTSWLAIANDWIYAVKHNDDNKTYAMFEGDEVKYEYTTGNLTEGQHSNLKLYNEVYFTVVGNHTVDILIDGEVVASRDLVESKKPIVVSIPQEYQRGSSIQFALMGTGKIKEIEYKVEGRQNGR